ncbi:copper chaperone CopZ [Bacillus weihaiensis]|uniref:Copper resistance protein CopZ n=1 Tax=Bacillus weihaiensis TaxID=1547283 RepID=A0A1L3MN08_9BACI|nr:copper chaperone CopZ [Bacillus weihaiensis]APH03740.1 copper resistance protein CopZ [Bacillus weihaiensis]
MENSTLKVEGMSCNHCVQAVEGSVAKLTGVERVKVNLENGTVDIEFDSKQVTLEQIKETIDDQGYEVV